MRKSLAVAAFLAVAAVPAFAQGGGGRGGRPPVDHWMTSDSVIAAVGITDAQKPDFTKHYDALNAGLKKFAGDMTTMREGMSQPPTEEQMATLRSAREKAQADFDAHHKAIRDALTPEQQTKFDALAKPMFGGRGGGRRGGGQ